MGLFTFTPLTRIFRRLPGLSRRDIAIDLGTANTVIYVRGEGVVLFEPSVIAIDDVTGHVHAVGADAKKMIGRTPATIRAIRPLRHGVIADFEVTESMLRYFITKTHLQRLPRPRVVLCVPSGITDVEQRAVEEATVSAGAREAGLIEEPMAAAIGADLPVAEPAGNMVIDIGGGTTEVALISLGGIVVANSLRVGGYEMDEAIVRYVRDRYRLLIGQERAEEVKIEVGSALKLDGEAEAEVAGRDLVTGSVRRMTLSSAEVREALARPVQQIIDVVKSTLEETPPELSGDVVRHGMWMVGGGSLLRGLVERMHAETELSVHLADSPLTRVAVGAGRSLEELDVIERAGKARRSWRRDGRRSHPLRRFGRL
jgi:rod shape-determining protein MreB and related proteins